MSPMPFLRAATREALALTGHLLLYPTGILAERGPATDPGTFPTSGTGSGSGSGTHGDPANARDRSVESTEGADAPPVLLLHGFCDNRSTFAALRRSLAANGWRWVHCVNHSPLTWDIQEAAEHLGTQVEEVRRRTGHDRVDLVGHSLGGLIGRYYVQLGGGDARVRTLVTLGTPHAGTYAAAVLPPHPLARQMLPGSPLLTELAGPVRRCRTRFVSVWSDHDLFMVPAHHARLDHPGLAVTNVRVQGVGHLRLPVDRTLTAWLREELVGAHEDEPRSGSRPAGEAA